tara:strand:+ start:365 stop:604 length:240 start_codon:yes stop_codon:yes gene_type:complete
MPPRKEPKKAPEPVPTQDSTQFKASMVVDSKPTLKKTDIFEDMTDEQKKRYKHRQLRKDKLNKSIQAKKERKQQQAKAL